ncbi:MAG TPA: transglutaminase-like domain-containing protein [Clostridia bacterium]|nr:transglutaminase-like domain-containing protein [Clostridia bacterium]
MKKKLRLGALAVALIFLLTAFASPAAAGGLMTASGSSLQGESGNTIDTSTASQGYVTLQYSDGTSAQMKVGLRFNGGGWSYYDYTMGKTFTLELTGGSGSYTAALFKKVGTSYVTVTQVTFSAVIGGSAPAGAYATGLTGAAASNYPQYLASVTEISFGSNDSVVKKAAALCKDLKTDQAKILAIYNYIAKNFKYDYDFANKVISGQITSYTPSPVNILSNRKGVCYDFSSLFAAMCRSQGIPCKLVKGYSTKINGYHAWNSAYDSKTEKWYTIDLTIAVCKGNKTASRFSSCYMSDKYYTPRSST